MFGKTDEVKQAFGKDMLNRILANAVLGYAGMICTNSFVWEGI